MRDESLHRARGGLLGGLQNSSGCRASEYFTQSSLPVPPIPAAAMRQTAVEVLKVLEDLCSY